MEPEKAVTLEDDRYVVLTPAVDFDQLENVLVITQLKDNSEIEDIKNYD